MYGMTNIYGMIIYGRTDKYLREDQLNIYGINMYGRTNIYVIDIYVRTDKYLWED